MRTAILVATGLACGALGHGSHDSSQKPMVSENANWMTKHMAEEHHIGDFDASSFFVLHDYDADGHWEAEEILRTYGLMDESNKNVPQSRRDEIERELLRLLDTDGDGFVTRDEFAAFIDSGKTLPDMGTGPGHHGDDEYEYEIHHWEKYHNENSPLEELNHPEDIEHFKKHEELEDAEARLEKLNRMTIVEDNIPSKFRRGS
ncbi:putative calcium ion binding protein [Rostrohypoxylon terebratum]|nr:putative calcium ion binding protein [Rostrohypoxylon terebratum]